MTFDQLLALFNDPSLPKETIKAIADDLGYDGKSQLFSSLMRNPNIAPNVYIEHIAYGSHHGKNSIDNASLPLWLIEEPCFYQNVDENWEYLLTSDFQKWSEIIFNVGLKPYQIFRAFDRAKYKNEISSEILLKLVQLELPSHQIVDLLDFDSLTQEIFDFIFNKVVFEIQSADPGLLTDLLEGKFLTKDQLLILIKECETIKEKAKSKYFDLYVAKDVF